MHSKVAKGHDDDITGIGILPALSRSHRIIEQLAYLEQVGERSPRLFEPISKATRSASVLGCPHQPFLRFAGALLVGTLNISSIFRCGDLLHGHEEVCSFSVRDRVRERGVMGERGE